MNSPLTPLWHGVSGQIGLAGNEAVGDSATFRLRIFGIFAALLCLAPFTMDEAHAVDCGSSYRISLSDATCLEASWTNTALQASWAAKNKCADYGDLTVVVDFVGVTSLTHELTDGNLWEGKTTYPTGYQGVDKIECCIDESDLCKENQVTASSGDIQHYNSSSNTWNEVDVSSHQKRYEHCEDNSTSVYCINDPMGDAFTAPQLCRNETEQCTASNCAAWSGSNAANTCQNGTWSFDDSDVFQPTCTITADCLNADGDAYISATGTAPPWKLDEMENCRNGTIALEC